MINKNTFDSGIRNISGCGLVGLINKTGEKITGEIIIKALLVLNDRGNGLGAGFAAYGIYPQYKDHYAIHLMYDNKKGLDDTEEFLQKTCEIEHQEMIPIYPKALNNSHPILKRYFLKPIMTVEQNDIKTESEEDEQVVKIVMTINEKIDGAFVFSSGKNMGAFKGVGFPKQIAEFFKIDEYEGYIWVGHTRFPTNTPGWWGGAHPFTLLDWAIIHNGEISSYGINKRYLEMFGYKLSLMTDTEVATYLLDLLIRKHKFSIKTACTILAPPFWKDIDKNDNPNKDYYKKLRMVYGSASMNGPFAILFAHKRGLVGFNDRIKLRPLIIGKKGQSVYMSSEQSAIYVLCNSPEKVWAPRASEPVITFLNDDVT
jgi:glutamate synthase domain-containing protein 1